LGNKDKIFFVGFSQRNERKYKISDFRKLDVELTSARIDYEASVLDPYYDEDTEVMMLWGKGDTSIKFYEIVDEDPYCHFLTEYKTNVMQVGIAFLHKSLCDVKEVEIARVLKLTLNSVVPIKIKVPRTKMDYFQDDIYPPTRALEPTMNIDQYLSADNVLPPKTLDLNPGLPLLSSAPKIVRKMKKIKKDGEKVMDQKDMEEKTINVLYDRLMEHKDDEDMVIPGENMEGVASDEWDDSN